MPVLFAEFNDLILDRRTISRANALNLARVERRPVQIVADRVVNTITRIANEALDLVLLDLFGRE